uniref:ATP synthase subunit a n=1 Tax=Terebratalia transversa TaxID=34513 RepID=Q953X5_TERTR|nr:ATP synthase F0 subunit 6 [Terebratalia transversa]AAK95501.1 ATPase synthase subunit 6 [Terebratalia transversa]
MAELFSSLDFDNCNRWGGVMSLFSWGVPPCIFLCVFSSSVYVCPSGPQVLKNKVSFFSSQVLLSSKASVIKGIPGLLICVLMLVMTLNLSGMVPGVFASTSHLLTNFALGVTVWLGFLFSSLFNSVRGFLSHFLPVGGPWWLNPFLVVIELVSTMIRPVTLGVRLAANMAAGHVLLGLLGKIMLPLGGVWFMGLSIPALFYSVFESGICIVQGYIFFLLLVLYTDDHS